MIYRDIYQTNNGFGPSILPLKREKKFILLIIGSLVWLARKKIKNEEKEKGMERKGIILSIPIPFNAKKEYFRRVK